MSRSKPVALRQALSLRRATPADRSALEEMDQKFEPTLPARSRSDHQQEHLESLHRPEGVRLMGWQKQSLTLLQLEVIPRDNRGGFTLEKVHQSVKRCGVLAQPLALLEGEEGYGSGLLLEEGSTHYGTVLVVH